MAGAWHRGLGRGNARVGFIARSLFVCSLASDGVCACVRGGRLDGWMQVAALPGAHGGMAGSGEGGGLEMGLAARYQMEGLGRAKRDGRQRAHREHMST